LVVNGEIMY